MLDRERVLAKIDVLNGYLRELREILPASFEEYRKVEKRRACERLLQVSIECAIDICGLIVTGLRLGLPAEEDDLFEKLEQAGIISPAAVYALADKADRELHRELREKKVDRAYVTFAGPEVKPGYAVIL